MNIYIVPFMAKNISFLNEFPPHSPPVVYTRKRNICAEFQRTDNNNYNFIRDLTQWEDTRVHKVAVIRKRQSHNNMLLSKEKDNEKD